MSRGRPPAGEHPFPCPDWCAWTGVHVDEWTVEVSTGLPIRFHETDIADGPVVLGDEGARIRAWTYLSAAERLYPDGRRLGPVRIQVGVDDMGAGPGDGLTPGQARALAAQLVRVADEADRINEAEGAR